MNFKLKKTYSFATKLPSLLNLQYNQQKVKGILTHDQAVRYTDITSLHTSAIGLLPSLPANVTDLTYILFESVDKKQTVMAYEYIEESTIKEVTSVTLAVTIENIDTEDTSLIVGKLRELGYTQLRYNTTEV